jgi:hypothetical protein
MISSILLNQYDEWEQLFHQPSTKLNPTLISFFVANHFSQIAFKSGKSAKDLAVAFIRRTTGSSL